MTPGTTLVPIQPIASTVTASASLR